MTAEPETEWMNISFNLKIVGTEVEFPEVHQRSNFLRGLAQSVTYLLLPDFRYSGVKVFANELSIEPITFLTDDVLSRWMKSWQEGDESDP